MTDKEELRFASKTIAAGNNAKTIKGDKEYLTAIMYLAPWKALAGQNSCSMAELAGCHEACLYTAGRGQMNSIQTSRLNKTRRYYDDRQSFMEQLDKDITRFTNYCKKNDVLPAVRLNGTSDIRWERENYGESGQNVFDQHPTVQFYDYTKIANRKITNDNYDLTFSYSNANPKYEVMHKIATGNGQNVAVVFRDKDKIPTEFLGMKVVDGDRDDLRFLDEKNVVVALYAKGKAKKDYSGFVIDV